jgi:hypothetical protein
MRFALWDLQKNINSRSGHVFRYVDLQRNKKTVDPVMCSAMADLEKKINS